MTISTATALEMIQSRAELVGLEVHPVDEGTAFQVSHLNDDRAPIVIYRSTNLEHVAHFVRGYAA